MNNDIARGSRSRACQVLVIGLSLVAAMAAHSAASEDTACQPVFDAISRMVKSPNHQFLTQSNDVPGNLPHASEIISTGKTTYILHEGKWETSSITPEQTLKIDQDNRKNSRSSCALVRSEAVDGVDANLYSLHSESKFGNSDGQIWLSKADSLPVHQKIDLAIDGKTGKIHIETRFVYSGIVAPAGVAAK